MRLRCYLVIYSCLPHPTGSAMASKRAMNKPLCRALLSVATAAVLTCGTAAAKTGDIVVFAAASTAEAVNAVGVLYAKRYGVKARAVFAASGALARQIANGAPADVYLSANRKWIDWLAARNAIVKNSRRDLFGNRLVLVVPRDSNLKIDIAPGFPLAERLGSGRLAMSDPGHVPAGIYARQALMKLGAWEKVGRRAARARDVRAALALVERGEAAAGIVYATDVRISRKVRIAGTFPRGSHAPITYTAALVRGRDDDAARKFHTFLTSPPALDVFARHGFLVE